MPELGAGLVSVVVPAHNAQRFIERTVKSIQAQTYTNLEIVVVDDGSEDGTAGIVRALMRNDARIQLISKPNGGVASARNLGLERVRGEYVAFVDADDLFHRSKLEAQVKALKDNPDCEAAFVLYVNVDSEDRVIRYQLRHDERTRFSLPSHLVLQPVGNGSSLLVRREAAIAVGGFEPSYAAADAGGAEDFDFELKLAARAPLVMVPEYLLGYRVHPGSMSSNRPMMARSLLAVVENGLARSPQLPAEVRILAYRVAFVFAVKNLLFSSHYSDAWHTFIRYAKDDPTGALSTIVFPYAHRLVKIVVRKFKSEASVKVAEPEVFFEEIGRSTGKCRILTKQEATRLRRLDHRDGQWCAEREA